jgi:hypothetical protein
VSSLTRLTIIQNQQAIDAIRDRQEGRPNNFDVEQPAKAVEREVFEEIKKKRP